MSREARSLWLLRFACLMIGAGGGEWPHCGHLAGLDLTTAGPVSSVLMGGTRATGGVAPPRAGLRAKRPRPAWSEPAP